MMTMTTTMLVVAVFVEEEVTDLLTESYTHIYIYTLLYIDRYQRNATANIQDMAIRFFFLLFIYLIIRVFSSFYCFSKELAEDLNYSI